MDLSAIDLSQWAIGLVAAFLVLVVAVILWRILKRAIGGCISMALGCLVLVIGLVLVALFLLSRAGVVDLDGLLHSSGIWIFA